MVSHQVPCGPCYKRTCPIYNKECLRLVQVDEVLQAVLRRLEVSKQKVSVPFRTTQEQGLG